MISESKLQYVLLVLAAVLTFLMVFASSRTLVVFEIMLPTVVALSLILLIRRWKAQEAIRSAWASIVLAAGAIISYKLRHSGALIFVPGVMSAIFAIFAVREFRRAAQAQREGGVTSERG